eukprot:804635-Pyramimonas_sp.AAC.1
MTARASLAQWSKTSPRTPAASTSTPMRSDSALRSDSIGGGATLGGPAIATPSSLGHARVGERAAAPPGRRGPTPI